MALRLEIVTPEEQIFSDDVDWCRAHFHGDDVTVCDAPLSRQEPLNDMRLMSECRHNIVANSTFSWWGAWLNGNPDKIESIGSEIDEKYYNELLKLSISQDAIKRQKDLKIVFSPIHGTGAVSVPPILKKFGFENVICVEEQMEADGNFPTVIYPNPEEHEALAMALAKAKEVDADLVMATDPDADRVGIAIKNNKGEFILVNGNQAACLLIRYVLTAWEKAGKITGNENSALAS